MSLLRTASPRGGDYELPAPGCEQPNIRQRLERMRSRCSRSISRGASTRIHVRALACAGHQGADGAETGGTQTGGRDGEEAQTVTQSSTGVSGQRSSDGTRSDAAEAGHR